jgi:hypothetical protein
MYIWVVCVFVLSPCDGPLPCPRSVTKCLKKIKVSEVNFELEQATSLICKKGEGGGGGGGLARMWLTWGKQEIQAKLC